VAAEIGERERHRMGRPSEGFSLTMWCEENWLLGGATLRALTLTGGATSWSVEGAVMRCTSGCTPGSS
jgi:hypothetical protein